MIYDLFMYAGEEDILDLRLNILSETIDYFIIFESKLGHTLIQKPLYFLEQKERFEKFKDKIIYINGDFDYPNPFFNDWAARLALFSAIPNPKSHDIIHHSDNDEITDPEILKDIIKNLQEPVNIESKYYFYCLDLYGRQSNDAIIMKYQWCNQPFYKFRDGRNSKDIKRIQGGWHYSSVNTPKNIVLKWTHFCHASEISEKYKNEGYIISQIKRKAGSWDEKEPDDVLKLVPHEYPFLPKYLIENEDKFSHLFWEYYNK